jgi:hypothetical protein
MIVPATPAPTSPEIEAAKTACVSYLPKIEAVAPGDGGALKVPYQGTYVRVTCYHKDGQLVVRVSKPHRVRHYHLVMDETRP